jgi:hypothetical protein
VGDALRACRYFLQQGYCVIFLHRTKSLQPFEARLRAATAPVRIDTWRPR